MFFLQQHVKQKKTHLLQQVKQNNKILVPTCTSKSYLLQQVKQNNKILVPSSTSKLYLLQQVKQNNKILGDFVVKTSINTVGIHAPTYTTVTPPNHQIQVPINLLIFAHGPECFFLLPWETAARLLPVSNGRSRQ